VIALREMHTTAAPDAMTAVRRAATHVTDLMRPRQGVYLADFGVSLAVGWVAFAAVPVTRPFSLVAIVTALVASFALYRAAIFVHELAHRPLRQLRAFRLVWNVTCGIPLLIPSFLYAIHREHHARRTYGTVRDGEYLRISETGAVRGFLLLAGTPLSLPGLLLRFGVLAPLGWLLPPLRREVFRRASSLVIDGEYRMEELPTGRAMATATLQEACCFAYVVGGALLVARGVIPLSRVVELWAVVTAVVFVNFLRVLGAHRYTGDGTPMPFAAQVEDSLDYPFGLLAPLWAPVGLRYHAVHHLFPGLPYHALGEARRRIVADPRTAPLLAACSARTLTGSLLQLARRPRRRAEQPAPVANL